MTPKEKAFELYQKYALMRHATTEDCKKCVLITCDEVLENLEDHTGEDIKFWIEVKQEIIKL